ncbi:MAG: sigma-70 family RNA polymerase sigma factor [Acidimicrobiales bacterium]|nr:sigma-70 family RNA polymerase sigma factor [Acidimicrobiales bacterium]
MDREAGTGLSCVRALTATAPHSSSAAFDAWAQWYDAEAVRLVRFATFVAGPDRALDVVQTAMVRALRSSAVVADRRAFVNRIIVREAQRLGEREGRREALELRVVALDDERDPAEAVQHRPELRAAVRALSPQQRAVVFHTYWEDRTPAEVARLLGCSEGAVKRQLARARAKLREVMA